MNRYQIIAIVVAVTMGITVMIICLHYKGQAQTNSNPQVSTEKEENEKGPLKEEYKTPFQNAKWITVEKAERTTVEDDEKSQTTYEIYVVSDVHLDEQNDVTEDLAESIGTDNEPKKVSFEDGFGFSYENKNGYDVLYELLKKNGIDVNLNAVSFDEDTFEITKQSIYELKEKSSVLKEMLEESSCDELLESKVSYETIEDKSGVVIPDCFIATVKYKSEDKVITKSRFLQVSINNRKDGDVIYETEDE